jgi:hypothetical protein
MDGRIGVAWDRKVTRGYEKLLERRKKTKKLEAGVPRRQA